MESAPPYTIDLDLLKLLFYFGFYGARNVKFNYSDA